MNRNRNRNRSGDVGRNKARKKKKNSYQALPEFYRNNRAHKEVVAHVRDKFKAICMKCGAKRYLRYCYIVPKKWNDKRHVHKENMQILCVNCQAEIRTKKLIVDFRKPEHIKNKHQDKNIYKYDANTQDTITKDKNKNNTITPKKVILRKRKKT